MHLADNWSLSLVAGTVDGMRHNDLAVLLLAVTSASLNHIRLPTMMGCHRKVHPHRLSTRMADSKASALVSMYMYVETALCKNERRQSAMHTLEEMCKQFPIRVLYSRGLLSSFSLIDSMFAS